MLTERQRKIIRHAYETVPFYMNISREKGIDCEKCDDLADIPIVSKEDLVLRNDAFISAGYMAEYLQGKLVQTHTSGSTENAPIFFGPKGHLHCMEENAVIEILDEQGDPLPDGEEGEIVVTSLSNFAMPLIRYKIGDRGCFLKEACSCDDPGKVLKLTTGRSNDWVVDREGNLLNVYIFVRCVENINRIYEHAILQFQVIQHAVDKFTIKLVIDEECEPDEICRYFMENLWQGTLLGADFRIQIYPELMPEERSGKLKWFVSEIEDIVQGRGMGHNV